MLALPLDCPDAERAGIIIETLSADSHTTLMEPLYNNVLGEKLVRDSNSTEMLDIIFDSLLHDIGMTFNIGGMRDVLITNFSEVASTIAANQNSWDAALAEFNEAVNS